MKKIDAHLHVAKIVAGYCRRGELRAIGDGKAMWGNGEIFQLFPKEQGGDNFIIEEALQMMKENGVEKAVLMQGSMYGFQNQYHLEIMQKYPEHFCPSCTVDPYMTDHLETLRKYLEEQRFHLVKFEISSGGGLMGCHDSFSLLSERMRKIYQLIEKNCGVLALDVGDITMESHQPENLAQIAKMYPGLKLVVCHLLAPMKSREKEWNRHLQLLVQDNVWFDIAALPKIMSPDSYPYPQTMEILEQAKNIIGSKKMMWGSDAPFAVTQDTYRHLTDYIETSSVFTQEEQEDIYYHNAQQVFFASK